MKRSFLFLCLLATACGPTLETAGPYSGIVDRVGALNRGEALRMAEAHCRKSGMSSVITSQSGFGTTLTFECVRR